MIDQRAQSPNISFDINTTTTTSTAMITNNTTSTITTTQVLQLSLMCVTNTSTCNHHVCISHRKTGPANYIRTLVYLLTTNITLLLAMVGHSSHKK